MKIVLRERLELAAGAIHPGSTWQPAGFFIAGLVAAALLIALPFQWAAVLLVAAAAFLLVLIEPLVGLALALLAGPFGALENAILGGTAVDSGQLLLALTLAVWIARGMLRRRLRVRLSGLTVPILLFVLVAAFTLTGAADIILGVKELLKWVEIVLIVLLVMDMVHHSDRRQGFFSRNERRAIAGRDYILLILLLAGLSQALIGIWQFALRGTGPEHFAILGSLYRAYGTYEQPNPFGGFMSLTALLALGALIGRTALLWQRRRHSGQNEAGSTLGISMWLRAIAPSPFQLLLLSVITSSAVASLLALIFSWSRGAWLGFAAGVAVLLLFLPKNRRLGLALLLCVSLLAAGLFLIGTRLNLIPTDVSVRLSNFGEDLSFGDVRGEDISDANYAVLERLAHWQAALDMARDNIWLGVGFGNYQVAYPRYALINWPDALGHAHNYYLNILAETGLVGLAAYLLMWTAVILFALRLLGRMEYPQRGVVLGLLAAWVALSVHHLVDKLYVNNLYIHLGVMFALLHLYEYRE